MRQIHALSLSVGIIFHVSGEIFRVDRDHTQRKRAKETASPFSAKRRGPLKKFAISHRRNGRKRREGISASDGQGGERKNCRRSIGVQGPAIRRATPWEIALNLLNSRPPKKRGESSRGASRRRRLRLVVHIARARCASARHINTSRTEEGNLFKICSLSRHFAMVVCHGE